jgi:hypothetical protein
MKRKKRGKIRSMPSRISATPDNVPSSEGILRCRGLPVSRIKV